MIHAILYIEYDDGEINMTHLQHWKAEAPILKELSGGTEQRAVGEQ